MRATGRLIGWLGCKPVSIQIGFVALAFTLTACFPSEPIPPTPTEIPTATIVPTPTTVWFPPTATWTPIPTINPSPTVQMRTGIRSILLTDNFGTDTFWLTGSSDQGTIALGQNELTLAVDLEQGYLFSFRNEPIFEDFYAEITTSTNICAGVDEYGVLFRYNGPRDFYRFSLSCDGQVRLDKVVAGLPSSPQPWLPSPSVPRGAPSTSRLGVWVRGEEMQFFINDEFQFAVTDRVLHSGMIGIFARSAGETAVTVSFSDLIVHQIFE
jgi:hypothetical protein